MDVRPVLGADQRLVHGLDDPLEGAGDEAFAGDGVRDLAGQDGIPFPVRGTQQDGILLKLQRRMALQPEREREVPPRREDQPPAFRQEVQGALDGRGIIMHPVTRGAEVPHVQREGLRAGPEGKGPVPVGQRQRVLRIRGQPEEGEYVGIRGKPLFPVEGHGIWGGGVIRCAVHPFEAG